MKVSQNVLDFLALIKLQAVYNLIRHDVLSERMLKLPRQRVGAIENRKVARPTIPVPNGCHNPRRDVVGFISLRRIGCESNGDAFGILREQFFLLASYVMA